MKKSRIIAAVVVLVLFGTATAGFSYLTMEVYKPEKGIKQELKDEGATRKGYIVLGDETADTALVFYPDEKVNYMAYGPIMALIAEKGYMCIVPEIATGLATLDYKAAKDAMEDYSEVTTWYIGGHGLGGQAAAKYAVGNADKFSGVVLLASFSKKDLTGTNLSVLSVYGDCDTALDMVKYGEYRSNLPSKFTELIIEGGNHAQFGSYGGAHVKDSEAEISQDEQQKTAAEAITAFMDGKD